MWELLFNDTKMSEVFVSYCKTGIGRARFRPIYAL